MIFYLITVKYHYLNLTKEITLLFTLSLSGALSLSLRHSRCRSLALSLSPALSLSLSGTLAHSPLLSIRYEIPNFHFNFQLGISIGLELIAGANAY